MKFRLKPLSIKIVLITSLLAINTAFLPVKNEKSEKVKSTFITKYDKVLKNGEKPNVLFIAIDDLNDWVGCMGGNSQVKTPNLDKFNANGGMVMYKAHAPATVCCPSRSALLTGVHAHKTGVYGNRNNLKYAPKAKDLVTLPEYFSSNGYLSLTMGKIFHKHHYDDRSSDHGQWAFDEYYNTLGGMGPLSNERPVNGLPNLEDGNPSSYHYTAFDWGPTKENDETQMMDFKTANWASDQLQNRDFEKPFFMAVGISKPHLKWYVPQKYFDMYPLDEIELPKTIPNDLEDILDKNGKQAFYPHDTWRRVEKYGRHKEAVRAYLATVTFVDDCIGVLLDGLENSKHADNTIVMLWGDHGWHLGEKQKYGKTQLWQETCRVPMMVKVPGVTPNNKRCDGLVNLIDMYPTLIDLCDLPPNPKNDGHSFAELLRNPDIEWNEPTLTTMGFGNHRIFDGRYSYISHKGKGAEQLYDHQKDSMEWTNFISDPEYADVKARLKAYLPETEEPESPRNSELSKEVPQDTTSKVWFFPGDSAYAWQYNYIRNSSGDILFSLDSSKTIGIYGCNDTAGFNIRSYSDANQFKDAAQFKWDRNAETFQKNGQWLKYSTKFTNNKPYQLLVRARKNANANFELSIFDEQDDTTFNKNLNLKNDFVNLGGGNDETDWLLSKFPFTNLWGDYIVRFNWYDKIGEPGIFGGFSFAESNLDVYPPEWYFVSIGTLPPGTNITAMTTEDATVYLVPEGTPFDTTSIIEAAVLETEAESYKQAILATSGLETGSYVLYAIDSSNNISEASRAIQLQYPVNAGDLRFDSGIKIHVNQKSQLIQVKSTTELNYMELYNILGKKIGAKKCEGKIFDFQTNGLRTGVYLVRVFDKNGTSSIKKVYKN